MQITAIKAQVKNPARVSVYVDGNYALSLNHSQLLDQKLHVGLQVDQARVDALKHASDFGKAYERSLMFAMLRPRSNREMRDYFRRKKWDAQDCEAILQKLAAKGYVNDQIFAKSWVQSRALTKNMSRRKLILELKQKGVAEPIIQQVLQDGDYNEQSALHDLIAKKRRLARYQDPQKLIQYLARQGFSYEDIKSAM